jgi:hypothetical protein
MTKNRSSDARKGLILKILGTTLVLTAVVFGLNSLYTPNSDKTAKAAPLSEIDLSNLAVNCTSVKSSAATTTCIFDLLPTYTLPTGFGLGIGDANPAGDCTTTINQVTCTNVPIGSQTRIQKVFAKIASGASVDTGDQMYIQPANTKTSTGKFTFSPEKGSTSPLFRSSDLVTVTFRDFKADTVMSPSSGAYTCTISARSFQPKSASAAWITLGSGVAYDPVNGCSAQFSKAVRGSGLNWSIKTSVVSVVDPTVSYDLYDNFVYRFQGSGIASGG